MSTHEQYALIKTADEFGEPMKSERHPFPEDIALLDTVSARMAEGAVTATSFGAGNEVHDEQYLTFRDADNPRLHYSVHQYRVRGTDGNGAIVQWLNEETGLQGSVTYVSPNMPLWYRRYDTSAPISRSNQKAWLERGGVLGGNFGDTTYSQEDIAGLTAALATATPDVRATKAAATFIRQQDRFDVVVPAMHESGERQPSVFARLGRMALRLIKR